MSNSAVSQYQSAAARTAPPIDAGRGDSLTRRDEMDISAEAIAENAEIPP